jgi:hypothetical protein
MSTEDNKVFVRRCYEEILNNPRSRKRKAVQAPFTDMDMR